MALHGAGELQCRLGMVWQALGSVILGDDGKLVFPKVAKAPAIYRLLVRAAHGESLYIGESDNLARRFGNYRNPGPTQQTSRRINALLLVALKEGAEVAVAAVMEGAWIDWGKGKENADLSSKVVRCLFENMAISDGGGSSVKLLNKARP